jgi:hypothetical protein
MNEMCTIELNLDRNFASSSSYHVDYLQRTIENNLSHAQTGQKTQRWALVGLAPNMEEALDQVHELRILLCKKHNRIPIDECD